MRLVLQHVEPVCMVGVGANGRGRFAVGTDVLVETQDGAAKPARDFVFCPRQLPDGGPAKVTLGTWRNCRAYPACKVVSAEAAADGVAIECGKDHVALEVTAGRTVLRGPFGEREIAPYPMTIKPAKKESRRADVDC